MVIVHKGGVGKKESGGRFLKSRRKRIFEKGNHPTMTKIGKLQRKTVKTKNNSKKTRTLIAEIANVLDPKTKKYTQSKIKSVLESNANKNYVRRNILTKGCVIDTEAGKAKVTSKPGQDGSVNAVLI